MTPLTPGLLLAQFVTASDPTSDAIRWASDGQFSHVDLVLPDGLLGAHLEGGVKLRPPSYARWTLTKRVEVLVPDLPSALAFASAQVGKPYNLGAILDMVLHRPRPFSLTQDSWFCDELLYAIAMAGGVQLLNTANPTNLTPWEVWLSPMWKEIA